ncbi:hypothetical protein [Agromyces allii]|uniref:4-amino-4-deoxy-L-arabinose transferase-like glycosyltransferase n=2 Tax=Agromyces allii TaxID=393607 RepID=A0ABN2Q3S3_9MICO|nr:hypothetical protein [Agromyces allii]
MSWRRNAVWVVLGLALLAAASLAATRVPVYGDDFRLAQKSFDMFDGSLGGVLKDSWNTGWQPNRFNPVGRFFAFTYHFLAFDVSAQFGVSIHWFYRLGAFVLLVLLVLAASAFMLIGVRFMSVENRWLTFGPVFAGIAAGLAITMQLHPWSHDPMLTISEIGLTSWALSFAFLALALRVASRPPSLAGYLGVGAVAVVGTMFYETFVAAVAAAGLVWLWVLVRDIRVGAKPWHALTLAAVGALAPLLVFVLGRVYVASLDLPPYPGTELEFGPAGLVPFSFLALGMVPASAWPEAARYVSGGGDAGIFPAGAITLSSASIATTAVIVLVLGIGAALARADIRRRLVFARRGWVVGGVLLLVVGLMLAMHSFTEKYIAEITSPGDIYLSYTGLAVVVVMIVFAALLAARRRLLLVIVLLPIAGAFVTAQQAVNWSVANAAGADNSTNRAITAMAVRWEPDEAVRCDALRAWDEGHNWRPYYREAVIPSLNANYERLFGEPFCAGYAITE